MSSAITRWSGPSMALGGLIWVLAYGAEVASRDTFNGPGAAPSPTARILAGIAFASAFFLAAGLLGVRARLAGRGKRLGTAGLVFAVLASIAAALDEVRFAHALGGIAVISLLVSATVLALASQRAGTLPRWANLLLLANGLVTFPLIVAIGIPLSSVLPNYAYTDLPFAIAGLAWIVIGYGLLPSRMREPSGPLLSGV